MSFFEVTSLSKSFGGLKALDDLSFSVRQGEIFAIIGPNGAGKSTLFNCINGLYRPERGQIHFQDKNLVGRKPHQVASMGIARTFQNLELFAQLSTLDNILLGRHLHMKAPVWQLATRWGRRSAAGREEIAHRSKAEEIIDFLELQAVRDMPVSALPYGTQKLVELGRALALEPKLLLLDEPAAGLNQTARESLIFWIKDIRAAFGITVLMIEHNMQVVTDISDRILALNFGQKLVAGEVDTVVNHAEVIRAYLG